MTYKFQVGDSVEKNSGDYFYEGVVVSRFQKLSGAVRYVIENEDGVLMIMNEGQLKHGFEE